MESHIVIPASESIFKENIKSSHFNKHSSITMFIDRYKYIKSGHEHVLIN